jgi:hypothetical protein
MIHQAMRGPAIKAPAIDKPSKMLNFAFIYLLLARRMQHVSVRLAHFSCVINS